MTQKNERKLNKIYVNNDEQGNPLTYSVLIKMNSGTIIEMIRNTRRELECFSLKNMEEVA